MFSVCSTTFANRLLIRPDLFSISSESLSCEPSITTVSSSRRCVLVVTVSRFTWSITSCVVGAFSLRNLVLRTSGLCGRLRGLEAKGFQAVLVELTVAPTACAPAPGLWDTEGRVAWDDELFGMRAALDDVVTEAAGERECWLSAYTSPCSFANWA